MIDFRYHIVSIVSIFLALAVGIVLGAGPLQKQLGETLNEGVTQLRQEKLALRDELSVAQKQIAGDDKLLDARSAGLVRDELAGQAVAVVLLPGANRNSAKSTAQMIQQAGGTVTGQLRLEPSWIDQQPERAAARTKVLGELPAPPTGSAAGEDNRLAEVLAGALLTPLPGNRPLTGPVRDGILQKLQDSGLIEIDEEITATAGALVVVAGPPAADDKRWAQLASTVSRRSSATVVAAPLSSAEQPGLIGEIRNSDRWEAQMSTVDGIDRPAGQVVTVLAIASDIRAEVDHFGTGPGAQSAVPAAKP